MELFLKFEPKTKMHEDFAIFRPFKPYNETDANNIL